VEGSESGEMEKNKYIGKAIPNGKLIVCVELVG